MKSNTLKMILFLAAFILGLMALVAGFNFAVDPMCYYRCDVIDTNRQSQNVYYQAAQIVGANPEAQVVILGSSRGETTSALWVEEVTGLKTINLSKGGAGLLLKVALLRTALDQKLPLKKVIWIADYFELAGEVTDVKVRQTPVLREKLLADVEGLDGVKYYLEHLQSLISHNTLEAAIHQLNQKKSDGMFAPKGSGSGIDYQKCASADYAGKTTPDVLAKEIDVSYSTFGGPMKAPLNPNFVELFKKQIKATAEQGVEVLILVPPFHPEFARRHAKDHPEAVKSHQEWLEMIRALQSDKVYVQSYWDGVPGDDAGPSFWDDGSHATCKAMMLMLKPGLSGTKAPATL
ncbi:hypothetical protein Bb109J_c1512 [Bdellovibrio bacteriovorus]|uniref:hypothetical protein n=1 Tax=Bdellovibrio bacteriovorus TaxID=959 RepID=UPI00045C1675|nr:hypothetical protein [Bdellovibrio bacteriovorus]AHZ84208.1 hypothetical protein EP01_04530 [Bdellovibrio bacteriovorus]BEV68092.1 hypothetical protein Bb109J_c1512 [Bdellovibrio bacteriovorus]